MPTVIAKTIDAHRNLPARFNGERIHPKRHTTGALAGYTTIEVRQRTADLLATDGWSVRESKPEKPKSKPAKTKPSVVKWAEQATAGSVKKLRKALKAAGDGDPVLASHLHDAERQGKDRKGAHDTIDAWVAVD